MNMRLVAIFVVFLVVFTPYTGFTKEIKDMFYLISLKDSFELIVTDAYIYDFPKLPSSWVYVINKDSKQRFTYVAAVAKSDKHTFRAKDLEKFVILRQPKELSDEYIKLRFIVIYKLKNGRIGTETSEQNKLSDSNYLVEIHKCLPRNPSKYEICP